MGERAQVHIEDTDVYLYTHWGARDLPNTVANSIGRNELWHNPEYLTGIIFDEMTGDEDASTRYGIGDQQHGDVYRVVHVNCEKLEMTVETGVAPWHDNYEATSVTFSFKQASNGSEFSWPER